MHSPLLLLLFMITIHCSVLHTEEVSESVIGLLVSSHCHLGINFKRKWNQFMDVDNRWKLFVMYIFNLQVLTATCRTDGFLQLISLICVYLYFRCLFSRCCTNIKIPLLCRRSVHCTLQFGRYNSMALLPHTGSERSFVQPCTLWTTSSVLSVTCM